MMMNDENKQIEIDNNLLSTITKKNCSLGKRKLSAKGQK